MRPTEQPSNQPSSRPSVQPSNQPSAQPSRQVRGFSSTSFMMCPALTLPSSPDFFPSPPRQPTMQPSRQPSQQVHLSFLSLPRPSYLVFVVPAVF
jgi:hypothetical protein